MLRFLLLFTCVALSAAKVEQWDKLQELIEDTSLEVDAPAVNPCEDHYCSWGKECKLTEAGDPQCECAESCEEDNEAGQQVCSHKNETFASICELYRQRCLCKRELPGCRGAHYAHEFLEHMGKCKELEPCTDELMEQFPDRMADWLFEVMKELRARKDLHGHNWEEMLEMASNDDHLKHVYPVLWKFCELDKRPHDKEVSVHELIPMVAPVLTMESCIKPFLADCDANHNGKISLSEWGKCLRLNQDEISDKCN